MRIYWQKFKSFFRHFFTLDDTPHNIAAGFALGVFLGIIPGGVLTALVLATLLRINRASAAVGVLATNTWGTFAAMPLAALVGGFLFDVTPDHLAKQFNETYDMGFRYLLTKTIFFDLALPMIVGFFVVAGLSSLLAYSAIYFLLKYKKIKTG